MVSQNKISLFARIYIKLRGIIIPFKRIEQHVPKNGNIVDIGCGYGIFANYLASMSKKRKVIGIDLVQERISTANKIYGHLPNLNFVCKDITDTQLPKTDVITVIDVLHHIPSEDLQNQLLKSCYSVLSKDGKLILKDLYTKPKWKYLFNFVHDYIMTKGEPVLYQDQDTIKNLLKNSGFELEKVINIPNYPYAHILYIAKKSPPTQNQNE